MSHSAFPLQRERTPASYGGEHRTSSVVVGPAILTFPAEYVRARTVEAIMVMLYVEHYPGGRRAVTWTADMVSMN